MAANCGLLQSFFKTRLKTTVISLLIITHAIGLYMFLNHRFIGLTSLNLLLTTLLLLLNQSLSAKTLVCFLIVTVLGFSVECIGVNTGYLFGSYCYLPAMKPTLLNTPVAIGCTWYNVTLSSCAVTTYIKINTKFKPIFAALLATLLDILIEPIALKYRLWSWHQNQIPIYNYVCWFLFASLCAYVLFKIPSRQLQNSGAAALFFVWILFFGILNFAQ